MRAPLLVMLTSTLALAGCLDSSEAPDTGSDTQELAALPEAVHDSVQALLTRYRVPGAALAYVTLDSPSWAGGVGVTSARDGRPVDATTVFEAASLSKPLFAYAAMSLVEDGVFRLGSSLSTLGARPGSVSEADLDRITPGLILSHTSGLPRRPDADGRLPVEADPGTRWSYSGPGYTLLQQTLVQKLGFFDFDALAHTLLFGPLDMPGSSYRWREDFDTDAASGHNDRGRPMDKWKPSAEDEARVGAASSLHTSARDMARFLRTVLVDTATTRAMSRPQVMVAPELGLSWGWGWAVEEWQGQRYFFHWGANPHFRSFVLGSLDERYALVLLTNGSNGLEMADEVVALLTGRHHPLFRFYMLHPTD